MRFTRWLFVMAVCLAGALNAQGQQYSWTNFAGDPGVSGTANGTGTAAQFNNPIGVAVDGAGKVYVADSGNDTIREITSGGMVTTLAGTPGVTGTMDGTGAASRFNYPTGVAVDGSGNVYVTDGNNKTIREIAPGGMVTTLAGTPGVTGTMDGTGAAAQFVYPGGVAVDGSGNVYVADTDGQTIREIAPGGLVTTIAGTPRVTGTANGTGGAAQFNYPNGVAVDGSGNVYVADTENETIREIAHGGVVTTLAGAPGVTGTANGTGGAAQFDFPTGVAVDGSGNVYVADSGSHTIREIAPGGLVTTIGGMPGFYGSQPGIGSAARFSYLGSIAASGTGALYVADENNDRIALGTLVPFTIPPVLISPAANSTIISPITVTFSLPAPALPGSVQLTFDNGSGTSRVLALSSAESNPGTNSFTFDPANPTASPAVAGISGGASVPLGTYLVTLSYQDAEGNPAASGTAANVALSAVITGSASSVNSYSATLSGYLSGDYSPSDVSNTSFEWGTSTSYGNTIPTAFPTPPWFATLSGLARDTTYHYQFVAALNGTTYYGGDQTFTTTHDDPPTTQPFYSYQAARPAHPIKLDVLENDTLGNPFDTLTITAASQPAGGDVEITGSGTALLYTADSRYAGHDSFTYTISDGFGGTAEGIVYILNPYLDYAGTYQALLTGTVPGYLTVTLGAKGSFTGSLKALGESYPFHGALSTSDPSNTTDVTGAAVITIPRGKQPGLTLDLTLGVSTGVFGYTLNDSGSGSESGSFTEKVLYSGANPAPETGRYTVIIPPPTSGSTSQVMAPDATAGAPQGTGWASMKVKTSGAVSISGRLGDGTAFTAGAWLDDSYAGSNPYTNSTQSFPVYASVYSAPAGYIDGTMTFEDEPDVCDFNGALSWYKPPQTAAQIYMSGFNLSVTMLGSAYVEPVNGYVLDLQHMKGNAVLSLTGGGLQSPIKKSITIAPAPATGVVVISGSMNSLSLATEPSIGVFRGKFAASRKGPATKFSGVFFQKQNLGLGVFTGTTESGGVNITPQ